MGVGSKMPFKIRSLTREPFESLFCLDSHRLDRLGARRLIAESDIGFPCRISLRDARQGEEVLLCHFTHQPNAGPYRASGPVYVRCDAEPAILQPDEVPPMLRNRLLSLRAYDGTHSISTARVVDGNEVEAAIDELLEFDSVAYLHAHFAGPGCFACGIDSV